MSATIIPERLAMVADLPLSVGGHDAPAEGEAPCAACVMEKLAFITGQAWTDHPENCSPVIGAFLRSLNDTIDQAGRDRMDAWVIANVERLTATAGDGRDEQRGYLAADWATHVALPAWLEFSGAMQSAAAVRGLPRITDRESAIAVRDANAGLRDELWTKRRAALGALREQVRVAVEEALKEKGTAAAAATTTATTTAAAAATTATTTAAAAAAATATTAAATATTTAAATAATDATTTATTTAAAAATATTATAWSDVYNRVYVAVRDVYRAAIDERCAEVVVPLRDSAFGLLEAMVGAASGSEASA